MPINVVSSVQSIKDQTFPSEAYMVEQIENLLGEKDAAEFKNQIVLESVSDSMIQESSKIANIRVQLSEPLLEEYLMNWPFIMKEPNLHYLKC